MRGNIHTISAIAIAFAASGAITQGQVFTDSSGGKGMTPGGEAGANVAAVNAAAASPAATTSADEQMSRHYLEVKAQRDAAAARYGKDDPKLLAANDSLDEIRARMAAKDGAAARRQEPPNDVPTMPVYPRIVPVEQTFAVPAAAAVAASWSDNAQQNHGAVASHGSALRSADYSGDSPENQAARATLDSAKVILAADQEGLEKSLNSLRDQSHANFFVNWPALQAAGVDKNTPLTIQLGAVPLATALRAVLRQVGGGTANLSYTVDAGFITISTKDDLSSSKYQVVEVYNVGDFADARTLAPYPAALQGQVYEAQMNNLMDTIKATIEPDTWRDAGGTIGSIREFDGLLVINQTADNQREIERFLALLRAVRGDK